MSAVCTHCRSGGGNSWCVSGLQFLVRAVYVSPPASPRRPRYHPFSRSKGMLLVWPRPGYSSRCSLPAKGTLRRYVWYCCGANTVTQSHSHTVTQSEVQL
eukprot:6959665-Pyramimonas_sp.AAC.1